MVAAIEGYVDTGFGSGEEHAFANGIFPDYACDAGAGETGYDFVPGFAAVAGAKEIRDACRGGRKQR